jgi:hypothetical protein
VIGRGFVKQIRPVAAIEQSAARVHCLQAGAHVGRHPAAKLAQAPFLKITEKSFAVSALVAMGTNLSFSFPTALIPSIRLLAGSPVLSGQRR